MGGQINTAGATGHPAMDRFPTLTTSTMTPAQRDVAAVLMAGPRKGLPGPFNAWLRSPELTNRLEQLGSYLRFHSTIPNRLKEIAILMSGRAWEAEFELYAHRRLALNAGLEPDLVTALVEGERPAQMAEDESAVYEFVSELRRTRRVKDETYRAAQRLLGDQGIVELIALSGYYDLVSMTLNVAQVPVPADGVSAGGAAATSKAD